MISSSTPSTLRGSSSKYRSQLELNEKQKQNYCQTANRIIQHGIPDSVTSTEVPVFIKSLIAWGIYFDHSHNPRYVPCLQSLLNLDCTNQKIPPCMKSHTTLIQRYRNDILAIKQETQKTQKTSKRKFRT